MKIIHVFYGTYPNVDPERDRRNLLAQQSWHQEYGRHVGKWISSEATPANVGWIKAQVFGDHGLPFVDTLIDFGIQQCTGYDVVFLTNADVGFAPNITERIIESAKHGAAHLKRKEIGGLPENPTQDQINLAPEYCGMDGTVITPKWWDENQHLIPPMVWGMYGWDSVLRNLIRWKGGVEIKNALFHREHASLWNASPDVIYKHPVNRHNRLLLWQWILEHGGSDADHLFADGELTYK